MHLARASVMKTKRQTKSNPPITKSRLLRLMSKVISLRERVAQAELFANRKARRNPTIKRRSSSLQTGP